jgi:hypothetical protein
VEIPYDEERVERSWSCEDDVAILLRSLSVGQLLGLNSAPTPDVDAEKWMVRKAKISDEASGSAGAEGSGSILQESSLSCQPESES